MAGTLQWTALYLNRSPEVMPASTLLRQTRSYQQSMNTFKFPNASTCSCQYIPPSPPNTHIGCYALQSSSPLLPALPRWGPPPPPALCRLRPPLQQLPRQWLYMQQGKGLVQCVAQTARLLISIALEPYVACMHKANPPPLPLCLPSITACRSARLKQFYHTDCTQATTWGMLAHNTLPTSFPMLTFQFRLPLSQVEVVLPDGLHHARGGCRHRLGAGGQAVL